MVRVGLRPPNASAVMTAPQPPEPIRPSLQAALLLIARALTPEGSEVPRSVAEILARTGVSKSQAYEIRGKLHEVFPTMFGTAGSHPEPPAANQVSAVLVAIRDYLMRHPGSACHTGQRQVYSDGFRRFVVGLLEPGMPGEGLSVVELAEVSGVPYGTLKDWVRLPPPNEPASSTSTAPTPPPAPAPAPDEPSPPRL